MATINEKMTAIADEIRTLSGTTGTMGLDAMATNIGDANGEVSTQTDLLAQIASALEGKAAGSASGGSDTPTNVTLNFSWSATSSDYVPQVFYSYVDNGRYCASYYPNINVSGSLSGSYTMTVAKNSTICIVCKTNAGDDYGVTSSSSSDGISRLDSLIAGIRGSNALYLINNNGELTVTMGYSYTGGGSLD